VSHCDRLYGQIAALTERAEHAEARAEKAEARVAELEAQVAAWSPARCYGEEDEVYDSKPEPSVAELEQRIATAKVGYYAPCAWCWSTVFAPNGEQVTCHKCGRKTPVPAPEPTETVQKAPPPSPVGAPRSDQGAEMKTDTGTPGPVLGHPSGSESSKLDMSYPAEPTPAPKVPDRITWVPPQRGLTAEEADAYTELLGKFGSPKPREPDVSAEVGLMGALQDRIHKEAGPYRAAKAVRVEASPRPTRPPPGICELWERDGRYFGKYAEDGPDVELSVAQPDTGLVRVLVDPAAAAEVEARTGEVALKKQAEVWRDAVLESIPKRRCEGCANGTALAAHSLCPACVAKSEAAAIGAYDATLRRWAEFFTPPRAGLPSRDEVAAFLEARWPK